MIGLNSCSRDLCFAFLLLTAATATAGEPRTRQCFDFDWRFHLGDVAEAQSPGSDDAHWQAVNVPHDWSVTLPFSQEYASGTGYLPGGVGWYRKTFEVPESWRGREVVLHFGGVYRNSEVWLNGRPLGGRPYGYIPFFFRLTPYLTPGEKNVVAVRVQRENVADSRWYPGSGIYRHVWLTVTDPVHFPEWGTFVTTPRVTAERADVDISNEVTNLGAEDSTLRVETEVVAPDGKPLSKQSTDAVLEAGATQTVAHWHVTENPSLWSTETPTLYTAVSRIYRGGELVDEVRTPFGIRTFRFDPDEGFFLNNKPMLLKGLCMHHDAGVVGAAVPDGVLERRLRVAKEMGANAIRCSHNPMAEELYTFCDRLGLLVMDEAFDEWELGKRKWVKGRNVGRAQRFGYNEDFEEWAERDVADMVRRSRNHPSIILWSIGNEIDYPGDPYDHPEFFDPAAPPVDEGSPSATRLAVIAPKLIAAVKRHDPTRPVTMALSNMPASNSVGLAAMLDVCGYNYQEQFYQQDHADFPGRVIYGSENGRSPMSWQAVTENAYISGLFYWVGFDFLGEAGEWPNHGSQAGLFDTRGFLKPMSWWQKIAWSDEPLVRLSVGRAIREDGRRPRRGSFFAEHPRLWKADEGETLPVFVSTNCDEVRLTLNGKPIEANRFGPGGFFVARVLFEPGELRVEGLKEERAVTSDTLRTPGPAERIELVADRESLTADGQDVAHVELRVVDSAGVLVHDGGQTIAVEASGAGRLLGVDNGNLNDTTDLISPTKKVRDGRLLVIVQSTRAPGEIRVEVSAEGLPTEELVLPVATDHLPE